MRTWDIGKLLLERCSSPEDVGQVIKLLKEPAAIQNICAMLTAFSDAKLALENHEHTPATRGTDKIISPSKATKAKIERIRGYLSDSSTEGVTEQLQLLFRTNHMTNKEVEQWITDNFNISTSVSKDSLRKYLGRVLKNADLGLSNRILSAAQRLVSEEATATSDIKDFWDAYDKHFSAHE